MFSQLHELPRAAWTAFVPWVLATACLVALSRRIAAGCRLLGERGRPPPVATVEGERIEREPRCRRSLLKARRVAQASSDAHCARSGRTHQKQRAKAKST
jgi:hypothetical protein